ncbi:branched-chain amino acid transporter AzlD [Deltaproteobacteria bacterium Smac51]|nr:branched-chain amino acid transporter AzlD [Deltaproteobacteria bacterium Smac51]
MTSGQALITVFIIAAATLATRAFAFFLFPAGKPTPPYISYLGKVLPCATIALLIVYCLKHVKPLESPHGLPELIAIVLVAIIQYFSRNTLISIVAGTISYMVLIQAIFI